MKSCSIALGLVLCLPASASGTHGLGSLSWLAGCWANPRGQAGSGEYWQPPAGGTMLGVARLVLDGQTVEYEFLRLHEDAQGRVVYTATPSGQAETSFVATAIADGTATFENPAHDFPQRIVYARNDPAGMSVRIEGTRQGARRAMDFRFERVACAD